MRWGPDVEAEKAEKAAKEAAKKQANDAPKATGAAPASEARPKVAPADQPKALPVEAREKIPAWKRRCMDLYVDCKDQSWIGDCYACFRYCEGQRDWPKNDCYPPWERRR